MKKFERILPAVLLACGIGLQSGSSLEGASSQNWPQWRGPNANGLVDAGNPPIEWSETKNISWKVAVPGKGHATPIIWGDKVFLLTAVSAAPTPPAGGAQVQGQERGRPGRCTT